MKPNRGTVVFICAFLTWLAAPLDSLAVTVQSQIVDLLRGSDLRQTTHGIYIQELDQNHAVLASIHADQLMKPGSNMKLITTAAALAMLGPQFHFRTQLLLIEPESVKQAAETPNQAKSGSILVIRGDGDPALGDPQVLKTGSVAGLVDVEGLLDQWVAAIEKAGVRACQKLWVDDRVFDQMWVHPSWPAKQLQKTYCAQVAGLNFHENILHLFAQPMKMGQSPRIFIRPQATFVPISNFAKTGKHDNLLFSRKSGSNHLVFKGTVAHYHKQPRKITMHDPPLFFAQVLKNRLLKKGITVGQVQRVGKNELLPAGKLIYESQTTLFEVIARCNTYSRNLYAEALLKRLGHQYTGGPGSWNNGASAVRDFLQKRLGTTAAVVSIADGSGLSHQNSLTPRILVKVLRNMYEDEQLGLSYITSLSVGGVRGSLLKQKRFASDKLKGKVYAKTGYINGVSTLSGYLLIPASQSLQDTSHMIAFSLLFNNIKLPVKIKDIKHLQDQIVNLVYDAYRPMAS